MENSPTYNFLNVIPPTYLAGRHKGNFDPEQMQKVLTTPLMSPQQVDFASNLLQPKPTDFNDTAQQAWKDVPKPNPQLLKGLPEPYLLPEFPDSPSYYYGLKDNINPEELKQEMTKVLATPLMSPQQSDFAGNLLQHDLTKPAAQYTPVQNTLIKTQEESLNSPSFGGTQRQNVTLPFLSPREYEAQSQVYALKTEWKKAQEQIDALQKLDPKNENEKIQNDIAALKAYQKNFADSAAVIRNAAGAMGWNMTGMGANDNFDVATQLMAINQNRGMAELLDMPSTAAQKWNVYANMVRSGEDPYVARHVSEMFHNEFRENNIQKLMEGIRVYGTNGDGSLNEFGQMLAGKLYDENPYMYGNVVNGFASPKDIFGANVDLKKNALAQDAATYRTLLNNQNAWNIADARNKYGLQQTLIREDGQDRRTQFKEDRADARHDKDIAIKVESLRQKTPIGQFQGLIELGTALYGDGAGAVQFALDNFGGKGGRRGSGNGSGNQNEKPTGAANAMNAYKSIVGDIENGHEELAADTFSSMLERISKDANKYYEGWDDESIALDLQIRSALWEYFKAKHNYDYEEGDEAAKKRAEEQMAKDRAADKQKLFDSLKVVGTDISPEEIKQARQFAGHIERNKKGENNGGSSGNF